MKKILMLFVMIILFFSVGCSTKSTDEKKIDKTEDEIKTLLENRYKYLSEHNVDKHLSLWINEDIVTEEIKKGLKESLENIEHAKLIGIERNETSEKFYITQEKYKKINSGNLRVYHTTYYIKFKNKDLGLVLEGKNSTVFILVKEKYDSQWKISTIEGQGY